MWKSGSFPEMSRYVYERFCRKPIKLQLVCRCPDLYFMLNNFNARLDIFKLNRVLLTCFNPLYIPQYDVY